MPEDPSGVKKKIAVVGTAPPHWQEAPYNDAEWEVWSLSRNYTQLPSWDRWFELHEAQDVCRTWTAEPAQVEAVRKTYFAWLAEQTKPVYVHPADPARPDGIPFPFAEMVAAVPVPYFTNSVSWMIAFALSTQPSDLGVYGVDMALDSEYGTQRPSVEYWLGVAQGMGVTVHVPDGANLLKARHLYGYQRPDAFMVDVQAKKRDLAKQREAAQQQLRQAQIAGAALDGGLQMLEYVERNWP